jgi:hypothetical protein
VVEEGPEDEAVLVGGGPGRGRASLGAHRSSRRSFPAAAAGGVGRRWSGAAGPCPWPDSPGIPGLLGAAAVGKNWIFGDPGIERGRRRRRRGMRVRPGDVGARRRRCLFSC